MKKIYSLLAFSMLSIASIAQNASNLIIFSEDGLKFYVVLNGIRQNEVALTNVKVTGLTQPYYAAKIIFEDVKQGTIEKKYLNVTDVESKAPLEVTYKIKKNNKLENVMRYFSQVPIAQAAPASASVPEVHYNTEPLPEIQNIITTQQTTTTSGNGNGNISIGINIPGVNMSVNVNDPNQVNHSTTTTTTSYQTTTTQNNVSNSTPITKSTGCEGAVAMSSSSFSSAKQTISKQNFDDTKLTTAKQILKTNCLSSAQIKDIMLLFNFEATRLELAKMGYKRCVDANNYFLLNDAFSFESSVEELNKSIE
jgi:hypothetical protein